MKDKNGIAIKHRDILKINRENFCKPNSLFSVWMRGKQKEVYNPNCCKVCRAMRGSIIGLDFFKSEDIEVIGNLDTTQNYYQL